ncbi:phage tail protein, partial [Clostridium botulinum]|nr:phage tail protein [Clostridium botulinum]NFP31041.1 phage tail protein [Clostridium botulinum]
MQEENFGSILTNIGKAKVANATLLNGNIALKTLKVGDSNGTYYNPTEDQAELRNTVYECAVGAIKIDTNNPNWIIVETLLPGNVGGFTIREVGLFDADGDMIVVGKYPETYKPLIENGASKDINVRIIFEVSNTENVTVNINPSVIIATKEDINNLQEQIENNDSLLKEIANKVDNIKIADATIAQKGIVQLNNTTNSTSITQAATANA